LKEARIWFEKAIEIDPNYALAYAGLADANSWLYEWGGADKADLEAAERNCHKALELAPALSESHSSLGFVFSLAKRYDEAEQEFKKAISLNPNNFDAYYYAARRYFSLGRIQESADMFRQASEVRP
jgi:adenylate cyclase